MGGLAVGRVLLQGRSLGVLVSVERCVREDRRREERRNRSDPALPLLEPRRVTVRLDQDVCVKR